MRSETSVVINRPIEEVWAFASDPFNIPRWNITRTRVRQTSPGPIGLGTTFETRLVILGFALRSSSAITEWDPPHAYAWSGGGAGFQSLSVRGTFEPTAEGTEVEVVRVTEPGTILKLLWPIVGAYFRRLYVAAPRTLKRLLEGGRG